MRNQSQHSEGSLYLKAAWYSLLVPFTTPVVSFVIMAMTNRLDVSFAVPFFMLLSSLLLGLVSLRGIEKYGAKRILWKALPGILASLVLGFFALVYWNMSHHWHG